MKPVKQLICKGEDHGDCFRACVASILELAILAVPNFAEQSQSDDEFWELNNRWAARKGYKYVTIYLEKSNRHIIKDILCIASGKSPRRKDRSHAIVWLNSKIHDPHPSNDFLAEEPTEFTMLVPLDLKTLNNNTDQGLVDI
ncbi:MAG: hypothetical protein KAV87_17935 [Desulfobacteraceae bacterium]|nr:hypothetical protein [Desulfobacteraceae bacterium]